MEGIDQQAADFAASAAEYALIGDILGGTAKVRNGGTKYLPKHEGETPLSYKTRIQTAVLANFFGDAIRNISARPFGRDIDVKGCEGLPLEDVTRSGVSLQEFGRKWFADGAAYGESFVLCEFPRTNKDITLDVMREQGIRPYFVKVSPLSIYDYVEENGKCVHFRIASSRSERNGFKNADVPQVVVYEIGKITIYEKNKENNWFVYDEVLTGLDCVPVTRLVIGEEVDGRRPIPPLIDAAYKQIEHYQTSVALTNSLNLTAYPMLAGQGLDDPSEAVPTGANAVLYAPGGGRFELLEPAGTSYAALSSRIAAIEREIQILGLQPLIPQAGNIAALVGEIQASKAHAAIRSWAIALEESLERALWIMSEWLGLNLDPELTIDTDFGLSDASIKEANLLLAGYKDGGINQKELTDGLIKRNLINGSDAAK